MKLLIPEYMKSFKCIGSQCEDTCCRKWKVSIDKNTYKLYRKINNIKVRASVCSNIKINKKDRTDRRYANIIMNKEGYCPFLDSNKLCGLYIEFGKKYLSDLCNNYPRVTNFINNNIEQSATTSCPEVARMVLFKKEGLRFEEIEIKNQFTQLPKYLNDLSIKNYELSTYFYSVRSFSIYILQNRNYSLDERMIILGIMYSKIQKLVNDKKYNNIPSVLEQISRLIEDLKFKEELIKIPTDYQIQMRIAKEIIDMKVEAGINSEVYLQCVKETFLGINYVNGSNIDDILEKYKMGYANYFKKYMDKKEYVLENFLINEFFKNSFWVGDSEEIWNCFVYMTLLYNMVKFHLIGLSSYNKGLTDEIVTKLIYSFSRMVIHDFLYIKDVEKLIKCSNIGSLAYMCILIKN